MESVSRKMPIFVPSFCKGWRHRGELLSFDPSENLENSSMRARSLKAVPPVECISSRFRKITAHIYSYRCELIFILTHTGIPEPSD